VCSVGNDEREWQDGSSNLTYHISSPRRFGAARDEEEALNHPELDMDAVHERLLALRAALIEESESSRDARDTVMLDQTAVGRLSRMDAMQGQAMAKAEEDRRQLALRRITGALSRIEKGEFGECIDCGEWIGKKRLEWDPLVLKCIDCAS